MISRSSDAGSASGSRRSATAFQRFSAQKRAACRSSSCGSIAPAISRNGNPRPTSTSRASAEPVLCGMSMRRLRSLAASSRKSRTCPMGAPISGSRARWEAAMRDLACRARALRLVWVATSAMPRAWSIRAGWTSMVPSPRLRLALAAKSVSGRHVRKGLSRPSAARSRSMRTAAL